LPIERRVLRPKRFDELGRLAFMNMAFGQTGLAAFYSWGDAPGYGELRPSA
jgi:hypothetical protein